MSFALLRQVSGGAHLRSGIACVLFTVSMFTVLSFVELSSFYVMLLNAASLLVVLWLAPIGIERQTRISKRHWPKLRIVALLLVASNIVVGSPVIAASFFWLNPSV
ncbi:accessory gene regulator B family protein [Paenibacillus rhizoplanae]